MEELLEHGGALIQYNWSIFFKVLLLMLAAMALITTIYDRYVQRINQILINFPLIGRMRYLFYLLRGPMRQYFGDEEYYDLHEKVEWVNKASYGKSLYYSFSLSKPSHTGIARFVHANNVYNLDEVPKKFEVTFGARHPFPFTAKSIIGRSAMSDGAISPEATQAFAKGAYMGSFPINTGEGSLTTNFLTTHGCGCDLLERKYLEIRRGTIFARTVYAIVRFLFNREIAANFYRDLILTKEAETYNFDEKNRAFFRVDWNKPLETFPQEVTDVPDIIFQIGSGLFGVRDAQGNFDPLRYQQVMRFCKMTEIKIAQGAKQSGGKLLACKVSEAVAWYRGVPAHEDIISPNRFPYANSFEELFDFVGVLQKLALKPVGIKIVVSTQDNFEPFADLLAERIVTGGSFPDFITLDGADGGSGAAPLETMYRTGRSIEASLDIVIEALLKRHIRDQVKIIASEKVLTPDDVVALLCRGADFINIARGFMMAAGCIRAKECSGANGRACPVGIATMERSKRSKFLIAQKAHNVAAYHKNLSEGVRALMAIMGKQKTSELSGKDLIES